jgi:hypothetical protein
LVDPEPPYSSIEVSKIIEVSHDSDSVEFEELELVKEVKPEKNIVVRKNLTVKTPRSTSLGGGVRAITEIIVIPLVIMR